MIRLEILLGICFISMSVIVADQRPSADQSDFDDPLDSYIEKGYTDGIAKTYDSIANPAKASSSSRRRSFSSRRRSISSRRRSISPRRRSILSRRRSISSRRRSFSSRRRSFSRRRRHTRSSGLREQPLCIAVIMSSLFSIIWLQMN